MAIEICTIGGYNEVGKNCTAINIDGEVIICDMGVFLDNYIKFTEDEDIVHLSSNELIKAGAIPDVTKIKEWRENVKAIIPTHAHLDHLGAIPFLADRFPDAEILGTPYTIQVLQTILGDEEMKISNEMKVLSPNSSYKLTKNIEIEFINMTHSTPQTVMVAIHTKHGVILYANDFKFDSTPTLGKKPNFERLKELGKKGILALITDSTYAPLRAKTPSEAVAKEMLREVMLGTDNTGKAVIVTTFSSHLARLKSIIEFGKKMNREILFIGRSLSKYVYAGQDIKLIDFSKEAKILKFKGQIRKMFERVNKNRSKYLLVVTGHQGEPKSVLSRMINKEFPFHFKQEDHVIFSSSVIPTELNKKNREVIESALKSFGVRIFRDVHVSGHAAREDLRDLLNMVKPAYVIPAHGDAEKRKALADLAYEMGYKTDKVILATNGHRFAI
jgi:ribonuclease J